MTFLYQFHPAGQSVSLGGENELSIGLASALSIEAAAFSTLTEAVLQSESVLDAVLPQDGQVLIHLPETLSLDECTAAYLAKQYLENGRIPKSAAKLAFYVQSSGDRTVRADANADTLYTLGFILLLLQEYYASYTLNERNLLLLEKSEILFKRASINLLLDPYYDLASAPIAKDEPQFVMEINSAADDFNRYISDKSDPDCCCVLHTPLPLADGTLCADALAILFWKQTPSCEHPLFWARLDGFPLCLLYEKNAAGGASAALAELEPAAEREPALVSLSQMLEYRELHKEAQLSENGSRSRRTRRDPAQEAPSLGMPFDMTTDPWHLEQGRLLSPRAGTCLSAEELADAISALSSCTAARVSLRTVLPFILPPAAVTRLVSALKATGFAAAESPAGLTDYSADTQPLYFLNPSASSVPVGERSLPLTGGASLCLYHTGVGLLSFETLSTPETVSFNAVSDVQSLQADIAAAAPDALREALGFPEFSECAFEPVQFFTALQMNNGYLHLGSEQPDRDAYRVASGDAYVFSADSFSLYRPDLHACICYDARGCALICAGSEPENLRFTAFTGQYYFLYAALLQRKLVLEKINRTLFTLSPINAAALKKNRRLLLYMDNTVLTPPETQTEAAAFFSRGQEIFQLAQAAAAIRERLQAFQDFLQQQAVIRILRLCCLCIPVLIAVLIFSSGLIQLPPLLDFTNGFSINSSPLAWLLWLITAALLGGGYWLCYRLAMKRKK